MNEIKIFRIWKVKSYWYWDGSEQYLNHEIIGPRIEINSTILVGDHEFELEYIIEIGQRKYRFINSNITIIVEMV